MIKRTISIGKPCRVKLEKAQLVLEMENQDPHKVPIEDIGIIILDHPQISVTQRAITSLVENNSAVLWSDERHLPIGLVLPLAQNSLFSEKLGAQLAASIPLKKQIWKQLVQSKIRNQGKLLENFGHNAENMYHWASKVQSGDKGNLEARAAAYYWKTIFSDLGEFIRGRYGDPPNNLLNYGYAILRAIIARSLVASGCLPAIGVHHHNKYNPYCLADDVMEPFRPWVDWLVIDFIRETGELPEILEKEHKRELLLIPQLDVTIGEQKSPLMHAAQRTTASLMRCFEGTDRKLLLPEL